MRAKPIIVFVARNDPEMIEAIMKTASECPDLPCCYFSEASDAMGSKADAHVMTNGVYILKDTFARGFDLKFAVNAHVIVYAAECIYSASTIKQMVGRANRAQGIAHGRVYVIV